MCVGKKGRPTYKKPPVKKSKKVGPYKTPRNPYG